MLWLHRVKVLVRCTDNVDEISLPGATCAVELVGAQLDERVGVACRVRGDGRLVIAHTNPPTHTNKHPHPHPTPTPTHTHTHNYTQGPQNSDAVP